MRKLKIIHFILLFLIIAITSCSINKDSIINNKIADAKTIKHLSHSGKFGRCSLCNNLALANQSTDSAVMPLAVQPEEQEQIFASNATQDNIILKPSKHNFEESFENSSSKEKKESESIINKKSSSYKIQKQSKPESKDSTIKDLLISLGIIALIILGLVINPELTASIFFTSLMLSPLIYGLYKLFRLLFQAIKETPKKKKIYWLLVPILILPALFVLLVLLPILVVLSPLAIIYVTYRLIRTRKKEKSAAQKLGRLTLIYILIGLLALAIFVPWFFTLFF
jgi:uncharacterized membrane protein YuzA (DUF378 family)